MFDGTWVLNETLGSSWAITEGEAELSDVKPVDIVGAILVDTGRPLENSSFTIPQLPLACSICAELAEGSPWIFEIFCLC